MAGAQVAMVAQRVEAFYPAIDQRSQRSLRRATLTPAQFFKIACTRKLDSFLLQRHGYKTYGGEKEIVWWPNRAAPLQSSTRLSRRRFRALSRVYQEIYGGLNGVMGIWMNS